MNNVSTRDQVFGVRKIFRTAAVPSCVALVLMQMSAQALADSAVGQNTTLGNAAHPAPINPVAQQSEGFDPDATVPKRSPSGLMYSMPYADEEFDTKGTSVRGAIAAGAVVFGGDKDAALYKQYKDPNTGAAIDSFSVQVDKPETATFLELVGGNVGRSDQFFGAQFGRYNDWKIQALYNEIQHTFTTSAKSLWNGIGTGNLTLKPGLSPGAGVVYIGANTVAAPAGAAVNNTTIKCANPTGGTALPVGAPCFTSTVFGSPVGTPNYVAAGSVVSPIVVGVAVTANALDAAATNRVNGGINALVTRAAIAAQNAMGYSEIGLVRKNAGLSLDKTLTDNWKMFVTGTAEKRQGARPFAMVQGNFIGPSMEIAEPIDYLTTDFKAGVRYADALTQFNLVASASFFSNNIGELVVDAPTLASITPFAPASATSALVDRGRFDLAPDNQAYDIAAEYARALPDFFNGQFTATVSVGTSRQDDDLLRPTLTAGMGTPSVAAGAFNGNFNQWNTTAALSQQSANARIDNHMVDLKLSLHPVNDLTVAGKLRYQSTDTKTNYLACNPNATYGNGTQYSAYGCTGVWGRLLNDGGMGAVLVNTGTATSGLITAGAGGSALPAMTGIGPIRNIPWSNTQLIAGASADYRFNKAHLFNAAYERETVDRTNREVDTTWEDKYKVGYVNRSLKNATLRMSYEYDRKRGSGYNSFPYVMFTGAGFFDASTIPAGTDLAGAYVARLANIHKLDVADRDQNILNTRLNFALRPDMDLGVNYQYKNADYPTNDVAGRSSNKQHSLNFDLNYQPSPDKVIYGYYSYQGAKMHQNNVQNGPGAGATGPVAACSNGMVVSGMTVTPANAAAICGNVANSITFRPINAYSVKSNDTNHALGGGFKLKLGSNTLDIGFLHLASKTRFNYDYTIGGAVSAALAGVAGSGYPDINFQTNQLNASMLVPVSKKLSVLLLAGYEKGKVKDWRYPDSLNSNLILATGNSFQLDAGPQSYEATSVGFLLQYKL